jgi:hypothetical protein
MAQNRASSRRLIFRSHRCFWWEYLEEAFEQRLRDTEQALHQQLPKHGI